MTLLAGLFAALAAIVGAIIWAVITNLTGYQIGWMAIGMGALIGAGTKFGGGEGKPAALFAGGLAIVGMFLGNLMATQVVLNKAINEEIKTAFTRQDYNEALAVADELVTTPEDQYPDFMVKHAVLEEVTSHAQVTAVDIQNFKDSSVPHLRHLHTDRPDYETWRKDEIAYTRATIKGNINLISIVFEDMGIIGFLFMIMGLFAAMRVVGEWD